METRPIPVIDLAAYLRDEPGARERAASEVQDALCNVGFFSIVGHGVDWAQVEGIYAEAERYHRLDLATKMSHPMSANTMGYIPVGGARREDRPHALNAAFFMGRPGSKRNQFPDEGVLVGFGERTTAYYERMGELCHKLLPLYALAADMMADHFDQYFDPALATLRMTHYPVLEAQEDQWGIDPHSDAGFMTLLPTNPVAGLQIRLGDDDWFHVAQEPHSFVVNAGDTLRRWSNDRFLSTTHRAINEGDGDRYAIPYFFDPRVDSVVECLAGCTDASNPPKYEPLVYRDYLRSFMSSGYAQLALGTPN